MTPDNILKFWLDDIGEKGWFEADVELDTKIKERFYQSWIDLCDGSCGLWLTYPNGALAYIILADQFSRNMFRGHKNAFATDRMGVAAAKSAIKRGWDLRIDEPARQFFTFLSCIQKICRIKIAVFGLFWKGCPKRGLQHWTMQRPTVRLFVNLVGFPTATMLWSVPIPMQSANILPKGATGLRIKSF